jgi:hypothetical protein
MTKGLCFPTHMAFRFRRALFGKLSALISKNNMPVQMNGITG